MSSLRAPRRESDPCLNLGKHQTRFVVAQDLALLILKMIRSLAGEKVQS